APASPPTPPPTAAPASAGMSIPAARKGPRPGITSAPSPASAPAVPPRSPPAVAPSVAPTARAPAVSALASGGWWSSAGPGTRMLVCSGAKPASVSVPYARSARARSRNTPTTVAGGSGMVLLRGRARHSARAPAPARNARAVPAASVSAPGSRRARASVRGEGGACQRGTGAADRPERRPGHPFSAPRRGPVPPWTSTEQVPHVVLSLAHLRGDATLGVHQHRRRRPVHAESGAGREIRVQQQR